MRLYDFLREIGTDRVIRLIYCESNGLFYFRKYGSLRSAVATDALTWEIAKRGIRILPDEVLSYHS